MSIRSLKRKAKTRRSMQWHRARNRAPDNDGGGKYQSTSEGKGKAVARGRAPEEGQRAKGGDALVGEVDGRVEDRPDGAEEENRKQERDNDWTWKIMEGQGKVEDGVVLFKLGGEWRQVPCHLWAWRPLAQQGVYKQCTAYGCDFRFNCLAHHCSPVELAYWDWIPKLIFTPAHIRDSLKSMSPWSFLSRPRKRRDAATLGAQVPPELFPLILNWVEGELARTCRLVCRYWEQQCRQPAFTKLLLRSHKQVLELVRFKYDPAWRRISSSVENIWWIPPYDDKSPRPWLHLLDPRWRGKYVQIEILGPFAGRRTIRSIHFALPRSVPPSFSRGITWLSLFYVNFCSFKDTASLVSELPDLERLDLYEVTWESLPSQLPRRRPRVNRNKLRRISVYECKVKGVESSSFLFPAFSLFRDVYSASSFFSPDIVTTADAILHLVSSGARHAEIAYNPEDRIDAIMNHLCFQSQFASVTEPMLIFSSPKHDSVDDNSISVFIDFDHPHIHLVDNNSDKWATLNTTIGSLRRRTQFLFGFHDRARMIRFAADVVDNKLSSLSTRGKVQYTMAKTEKRKEDDAQYLYWYQASLESEALQGEGIRNPLKVYP